MFSLLNFRTILFCRLKLIAKLFEMKQQHQAKSTILSLCAFNFLLPSFLTKPMSWIQLELTDSFDSLETSFCLQMRCSRKWCAPSMKCIHLQSAFLTNKLTLCWGNHNVFQLFLYSTFFLTTHLKSPATPERYSDTIPQLFPLFLHGFFSSFRTSLIHAITSPWPWLYTLSCHPLSCFLNILSVVISSLLSVLCTARTHKCWWAWNLWTSPSFWWNELKVWLVWH